MKVSSIMTENVITIRGHQSIAEAVKLMQKHELYALIVDRRHEEDAYGIITETDIIKKVAAFGRDPRNIRVYEVMKKPCIVVNPNLSVEYVARLFANTQIRCAPVIRDRLLGIVTATDILTKSDFLSAPKERFFDQEIEKAVAEARQVCQTHGHTSKECKVAWDIVEELQAEAAYQRAKRPEKSALEEYLEEYPEAASALDLDNWCSG
ncbi:MAG: CBS domain-containing protein [Synechocystis sp.]|nr:CBS domain-containing protein [Synechocystis sp.]